MNWHSMERREVTTDCKEGSSGGRTQVQGSKRIRPSLRNRVRVTLHTDIAAKLWRGRRPNKRLGKPALLGVPQFAAMANVLWRAAAQDDPYAGWWLCRVEQALQQGRQQLQGVAETLDQYMGQQLPSGIEVSAASSAAVEPLIIRFGTPHGFMAAYLLADFDRVARLILSARHLALIDVEQSYPMMGQAKKLVRIALGSIHGYRHTGVTRADMAASTQLAQRAVVLMGVCPQNILEKTGSVRRSLPCAGGTKNSAKGPFNTF